MFESLEAKSRHLRSAPHTSDNRRKGIFTKHNVRKRVRLRESHCNAMVTQDSLLAISLANCPGGQQRDLSRVRDLKLRDLSRVDCTWKRSREKNRPYCCKRWGKKGLTA